MTQRKYILTRTCVGFRCRFVCVLSGLERLERLHFCDVLFHDHPPPPPHAFVTDAVENEMEDSSPRDVKG